MTKLLTISIAAYNVENYLDKTLETLIASKYIDEIEILVVNDGSADNTEKIANKYTIQFPNSIKLINKKNGGHGSTINTGLKYATGKYFKLIDGDDWVDTKEFDKYIEILMNEDSDIVGNTYVKVFPDGKVKTENPFVKLKEKIQYNLDDKFINATLTLHSIAVKTNVMRSVEMNITEHCFYVDIEYIIYALHGSSTITYYNIPMYMYRFGNLNQSVSKKNMLKNIKMQEIVSIKLSSMYSNYIGDSSTKRKTMYIRIKKSIGATYRTFLMYDDYNEMLKGLREYDNKISTTNLELYNKLNNDIFIKLLRSDNFSNAHLLSRIYKIYLKI